MVDKRILDYLKKYSGKYPLGALRQKIISSGYSAKEVDSAINSLGLGKLPVKPQVLKQDISTKPGVVVSPKTVVSKQIIPTKSKGPNPPIGVVSKSQPPSSANINSQMNNSEISNNTEIKKTSKEKIPWMKIAGIFGFIILFILILQIVYNALSSAGISLGFLENGIFMISLTSINFLSFLLFYFGFVKLGKYAGSKLLKVSALMIIIFEFVFIALVVVLWLVVAKTISGGVRGISGMAIGDFGGVSGASLGGGLSLIWIILPLILFLIIAVTYILFSIGLIKISDNVRFAKISGVLNLVSIIIGILVFGGLILISILNPSFIISLDSNMWLLIIVSGLLSLLGLLTILFESLCLLNASNQFD